MVRALLIDDAARQRIQAAMARARQRPTPEHLLKEMAYARQHSIDFRLSDRPPKADIGWKEQYLESVELERGFTAVISFEQQPVGLCKHLSISVPGVGQTPHPEAVNLIAKEFGIDQTSIISMFVEEFEPNHFAVNVVAFAEPRH